MRAVAIAVLALAVPALAGAQTMSFSNSWDSDGFSEFRHTITGPPGRVNLQLDARTTAGGGETVAVYPVVGGQRGKVRVMFVIATTKGNSRTGSITLPKPPRGQTASSTELMVIVENASGRRRQGEYTLTATPGG